MPTDRTTIGLPPGTLIHIGERVQSEVDITLYDYNADRLTQTKAPDDYQQPALAAETVTWLDVEGLHDVSVVQDVGTALDIHPLILEDVLNTDQRPRLSDYADHLHLSIKMVVNEADYEHVSFILGPGYLISFQEGKAGDAFDPVRERLAQGVGRIRRAGPDYLLYALVDVIVDRYFILLEGIEERVNTVENQVAAEPDQALLAEIQDLKAELSLFRRMALPLREILDTLEHSANPLIQPETRPYWRSVRNHLIQQLDEADMYRETLSVALDIYLTSVNNRMTDTMNVLTLIMSIFIPLTFIAGVYGMNFEHMPELGWRWGYPAVWAVMILIGLGMLLYFRRRTWV